MNFPSFTGRRSLCVFTIFHSFAKNTHQNNNNKTKTQNQNQKYKNFFSFSNIIIIVKQTKKVHRNNRIVIIFLINPLHQYVLGLPEKKQTMMTVKIPGKKIKKKTCEMEK